MKLNDDIKIDIIERIKDNVEAIKIILFGSYAYGEPTIDSDIDLIIIEKNIKSKINELRKIRKALRHLDYSKDIIVVSDEEFNFYKNEFGSVYKEAYEKGEILYQKR